MVGWALDMEAVGCDFDIKEVVWINEVEGVVLGPCRFRYGGELLALIFWDLLIVISHCCSSSCFFSLTSFIHSID